MRVGITYLGVESERDVFELPEIGDAYWHGWEAARVHDIHGAAVPCIELVPDRERAQRLCGALPAGFLVSAGQRSEDGLWHAEVASPARRVVAWAHERECDEAVEEAVARAATRELAAAGYHPDRE